MKQYQQVCVSAFIANAKGEVLLVKRSNDDDFLPGLWEAPGGGTDYGEHPEAALKREIQEEVGLDIDILRPMYIDDYFMDREDEKIHRVEIFFVCRVKNAKQDVVLSNEHAAYQWIGGNDKEKVEMTNYMKNALKVYFESV